MRPWPDFLVHVFLPESSPSANCWGGDRQLEEKCVKMEKEWLEKLRNLETCNKPVKNEVVSIFSSTAWTFDGLLEIFMKAKNV